LVIAASVSGTAIYRDDGNYSEPLIVIPHEVRQEYPPFGVRNDHVIAFDLRQDFPPFGHRQDDPPTALPDVVRQVSISSTTF
jgi:hypothetical protein